MESHPPPSSSSPPPPPPQPRHAPIPPEVKGEASGNTAPRGMPPRGPVIGAGQARSFPRPPSLLPRLVMLCLRPETWAEMARYPSRFTIIPLIVAILMASLVVGIAEGTRSLENIKQFASTYDARYPALTISGDGTLAATAPLPAPIRFQNGINGELVLIDPTGTTVPATIKTPQTCLITDKDIWLFVQPDAPFHRKLTELKGLLPPLGTTEKIDGATMKAFFDENGDGYITTATIMWGGVLLIRNVLWAALMMFLLSPLVMLAAAGPRMPSAAAGAPDRRLILPRRASYRIAGAVLIPLVIFGAAMQASGHPVTSLLGNEGTSLFWFFSAAALCMWAGLMAKRMYTPKRAAR